MSKATVPDQAELFKLLLKSSFISGNCYTTYLTTIYDGQTNKNKHTAIHKTMILKESTLVSHN